MSRLVHLIFMVWAVLVAPFAVASTVTTQTATVRLIAPITQSNTPTIGIQFDLKPHWKIYWKNPGDAGYPPNATVQSPKNQAPQTATIHFPTPKSMTLLGMHSYAYANTVVFPTTLPHAPQAGDMLKLDWLACYKQCIPQSATLPLNTLTHAPDVLQQWQDKIPTMVQNPATITAAITPKKTNSKTQTLTITTPPAVAGFVYHADFPSMVPTGVEHSATNTIFTYAVSGDIDPQKPLYFTLNQTTKNQPQYTENKITITESIKHDLPLWHIVMLAFLGGLILNIMPCVLPVLGIKAMTFLNGNTQHARASFMWTAVGIVGSFIGIGIIVHTLKSAGQAIGWGTQFQSPVFLWSMFAIVSLFALMVLLDKSIPLPARIRGMAPNNATPVGSMLNGVLATVLSTPCSAPILGTAITLIISQNGWQILALFAVMGVGMATPYWLIAITPNALKLLPKPGAWMYTFRKVLGALLVATALWLGWLAWGVSFPNAVQNAQQHMQNQTTAPKAKDDIIINWQPFNPADQSPIATAVAQGRVVVVDITADWCLICQVNKATTLNTQTALELFTKHNVLALQKDWTLKDDSVPPFLAQHNRTAIPFTAVYGPNAPDGIVLSELTTPWALRNAIEQAK